MGCPYNKSLYYPKCLMDDVTNENGYKGHQTVGYQASNSYQGYALQKDMSRQNRAH